MRVHFGFSLVESCVLLQNTRTDDVVLSCSFCAMTSSVIHDSTELRKNEIYLLNRYMLAGSYDYISIEIVYTLSRCSKKCPLPLQTLEDA